MHTKFYNYSVHSDGKCGYFLKVFIGQYTERTQYDHNTLTENTEVHFSDFTVIFFNNRKD